MSEIVLVTQNDEPALAFGEYEISADGNTLYVGSAGVGDGSSEVIYKGISPAKIKYGLLSRLAVLKQSVNIDNTTRQNISYSFNRTIRNISNSILVKQNNVLIREEIIEDAN